MLPLRQWEEIRFRLMLFFKFSFYLKGRERGKESREEKERRERETFHLSVHSQNACSGQGKGRPKPSGRDPTAGPTSCCIPGSRLGRSWKLEWREYWTPGTLIWRVGILINDLTPVPGVLIFRLIDNIHLDCILGAMLCHLQTFKLSQVPSSAVYEIEY